MTQPKSESKKEEFRKYLESTGVLDAFTKVLVGLYEEPEKPGDALEFVKQHLHGGPPKSAEAETLKKEFKNSSKKTRNWSNRLLNSKQRLPSMSLKAKMHLSVPILSTRKQSGMHMRTSTSADAIDDDQWWLEDDAVEEATVKEIKVSSSKKTTAIEQPHETFDILHTQRRQRKEFLAALKCPQRAVNVDKTTIKKSNFIDCSTLETPGTPPLRDLIVFACDSWKKLVKRLEAKGSPLVLVFSVSALREVEMRRELVELAKPHTVAKLFSKHMKVDQQSRFLTSHVTPIAVATPERAQKLLDMDSLNLSELKLIVLDWYWRDIKMRRFSDIPEVWSSYLQLHNKIQKLQPEAKLFLY
eukprot:Em0023g517a